MRRAWAALQVTPSLRALLRFGGRCRRARRSPRRRRRRLFPPPVRVSSGLASRRRRRRLPMRDRLGLRPPTARRPPTSRASPTTSRGATPPSSTRTRGGGRAHHATRRAARTAEARGRAAVPCRAGTVACSRGAVFLSSNRADGRADALGVDRGRRRGEEAVCSAVSSVGLLSWNSRTSQPHVRARRAVHAASRPRPPPPRRPPSTRRRRRGGGAPSSDGDCPRRAISATPFPPSSSSASGSDRARRSRLLLRVADGDLERDGGLWRRRRPTGALASRERLPSAAAAAESVGDGDRKACGARRPSLSWDEGCVDRRGEQLHAELAGCASRRRRRRLVRTTLSINHGREAERSGFSLVDARCDRRVRTAREGSSLWFAQSLPSSRGCSRSCSGHGLPRGADDRGVRDRAHRRPRDAATDALGCTSGSCAPSRLKTVLSADALCAAPPSSFAMAAARRSASTSAATSSAHSAASSFATLLRGATLAGLDASANALGAPPSRPRRLKPAFGLGKNFGSPPAKGRGGERPGERTARERGVRRRVASIGAHRRRRRAGAAVCVGDGSVRGGERRAGRRRAAESDAADEAARREGLLLAHPRARSPRSRWVERRRAPPRAARADAARARVVPDADGGRPLRPRRRRRRGGGGGARRPRPPLALAAQPTARALEAGGDAMRDRARVAGGDRRAVVGAEVAHQRRAASELERQRARRLPHQLHHARDAERSEVVALAAARRFDLHDARAVVVGRRLAARRGGGRRSAASAGSGANGAGHNASEILGRSMTTWSPFSSRCHIDSLASTSACSSPATSGRGRSARSTGWRAGEARRHLEHLVLARPRRHRHADRELGVALRPLEAVACTGDRDARRRRRARGGHEHAPRRHHVGVLWRRRVDVQPLRQLERARALELRLARRSPPSAASAAGRAAAAPPSRCLSASGSRHRRQGQPSRAARSPRIVPAARHLAARRAAERRAHLLAVARARAGGRCWRSWRRRRRRANGGTQVCAGCYEMRRLRSGARREVARRLSRTPRRRGHTRISPPPTYTAQGHASLELRPETSRRTSRAPAPAPSRAPRGGRPSR